MRFIRGMACGFAFSAAVIGATFMLGVSAAQAANPYPKCEGQCLLGCHSPTGMHRYCEQKLGFPYICKCNSGNCECDTQP